MNLRLYDTHARALREFEPLVPGKVTMYVCGATVQGPPHVGHVRFAVNFDLLWRWFEHLGNEVTLARNVTDIDDKILVKAAAAGEPWWQLAYRNELAFSAAYDVLGCLPPTVEPRATGHVPEMIALIERLIAAGHAYASGGDVLFDVRSHPTYGELSGQKVDDLVTAGDTENASAKRDQRDFALWKGAKPGEPSWSTPWGPGRPGWHVECSAMATKYLGSTFDIHGGGIDLVFPHHENELAQSRAAGDGFARYWLHNAWVTMAGEKMSKSLGNDLLVSEVVKHVRPVELRYFLAAPHYRSTVEYSAEALADAATAYGRLEGFVDRASEFVGAVDELPAVPSAFAAAMNDDLGVPQALAVVHAAVREGNTALASDDKETVRARLGEVRSMLAVLGLDPHDARWHSSDGSSAALHSAVDVLVQTLLRQRAAAREAKDWAAADAIRDQLHEAGIEITDTAHGAKWGLANGR
ncbi:cysteine--tRNA ligase [Tenggerimyces flavus]|uniref:Cysteine--tRNA ligase n=1 Tax=Tenggerimyces flavus TaxID=1708749 RepID=A0ABV7YAT0_9ACTN|nr:cysteine--tRNA ligase [Tenggerimyces flavus]MBM7783767.1 cysteinyl-tRNA synthetase [Tenggerimyces flavus]